MTRSPMLAAALTLATALTTAGQVQAAPRHGDDNWPNTRDEQRFRDDDRDMLAQQPCYTQRSRQHTGSSGGGALFGAIVGGFIGNAIGHGPGQVLATGLGIIGGAMVGDQIEQRQRDGRPACGRVMDRPYDDRRADRDQPQRGDDDDDRHPPRRHHHDNDWE